jgi:hypothetical protein
MITAKRDRNVEQLGAISGSLSLGSDCTLPLPRNIAVITTPTDPKIATRMPRAPLIFLSDERLTG